MNIVMYFIGVAWTVICLFVGMVIEYRSGRFEHFVRRSIKPTPITIPSPVESVVPHDEFIEACERWNRACLSVPVEQRVLEIPERAQ